MMCMMGCFAVVRINPVGLILQPGNIGVAVALLFGAAVVATRRPGAFGVGMAAAALTALAGALGAAQVHGFALPGHPLMWIIIGLYIAFRLTLIQQSDRRSKQRTRSSQPSESGSDDDRGARP